MNFSQLIADFAEQNDVEISSPEDSSGPHRAEFDDGAVTVEFHAQSRGRLHLETEVTTVDSASEEGTRTLATLLRGNLALLVSQTGSLALADDGKRVLLYERIALADTDTHRFTEVVESFLHRLDTFRRGMAAMA